MVKVLSLKFSLRTVDGDLKNVLKFEDPRFMMNTMAYIHTRSRVSPPLSLSHSKGRKEEKTWEQGWFTSFRLTAYKKGHGWLQRRSLSETSVTLDKDVLFGVNGLLL